MRTLGYFVCAILFTAAAVSAQPRFGILDDGDANLTAEERGLWARWTKDALLIEDFADSDVVGLEGVKTANLRDGVLEVDRDGEHLRFESSPGFTRALVRYRLTSPTGHLCTPIGSPDGRIYYADYARRVVCRHLADDTSDAFLSRLIERYLMSVQDELSVTAEGDAGQDSGHSQGTKEERMNQIEQNFWSLLDMGMDVLAQALKDVNSTDLEFTPPGENVSLGELCRSMGDIAGAYAQSYRDGVLDISLSAAERGQPANGRELSEWIRQKEGLLKEAVREFSDQELSSKTIDRGGGWKIPLLTQFHVYREALLIFFGKLDVYLRMMKKQRTELWIQWVG